MKGSAIIAGASALLAGIVVVLFVQFQHGGERSGVKVGLGRAEAACREDAPRCLPKMTLTDTSGKAWTPDELADKIVVVNVWATWCAPCAIEIPDFVAADKRYRARGVVLLGLMTDSPEEAELDAFVDQYHMSYPIIPASAALMRAFDHPSALPTTFIYDRRGHLRFDRSGVVSASQLESTIDHLLAE